MTTATDALVRAIALLVAKGDTAVAESLLPWIYENKETPTQKSRRFVPPTIEEVKAYCEERGNGVSAEQFCSFYESKGWKVGNSKMSDWKACVRTWERRSTDTSKASVFSDPQQFWK